MFEGEIRIFPLPLARPVPIHVKVLQPTVAWTSGPLDLVSSGLLVAFCGSDDACCRSTVGPG
jgi:hypothetical protein